MKYVTRPVLANLYLQDVGYYILLLWIIVFALHLALVWWIGRTECVNAATVLFQDPGIPTTLCGLVRCSSSYYSPCQNPAPWPRWSLRVSEKTTTPLPAGNNQRSLALGGQHPKPVICIMTLLEHSHHNNTSAWITAICGDARLLLAWHIWLMRSIGEPSGGMEGSGRHQPHDVYLFVGEMSNRNGMFARDSPSANPSPINGYPLGIGWMKVVDLDVGMWKWPNGVCAAANFDWSYLPKLVSSHFLLSGHRTALAVVASCIARKKTW
jgi:hypothetical protein